MAKSGPDILGFALTLFIILLSATTPAVNAHSAVERLMRIAPNGTTIGPEGFPRGLWPRDSPGFQDDDLTYHIPPNGNRPQVLYPDDKLAHPFQRTSNYTAAHPPLKAAPGDLVVLQYQENGHTTLPGNQLNKPLNRGTVYVYGTSDFDGNANLLDIHYKWNPEGTGGDGKGKLIATRNFDDGQCYQDNDQSLAMQRKQQFKKAAEQPMGLGLWCQNDITLPEDLPVGKNYTLLWVWDWPTMDAPGVPFPPSSAPGAPPGPGGIHVKIPELYTTVMDVEIVDPCDAILGDVKAPTCSKGGTIPPTKYVVTEKDLNKAAIQAQLLNMFIVDVSANYNTGSANTSDTSPSGTTRPGGGGGSVVTHTISEISTVKTTVTTITHTTNPSANPAVKTVTVTTYSTTVTETIDPSAPSMRTKSLTTSTRSVGGTATTGRPQVTRFLKDSKPTTTTKTTAINKGRRGVGLWGLGADGRHGV